MSEGLEGGRLEGLSFSDLSTVYWHLGMYSAATEEKLQAGWGGCVSCFMKLSM
jgi:hypothetical protein